MSPTYTNAFYKEARISEPWRIPESLFFVEITDFDGNTTDYEVEASSHERAAEKVTAMFASDIYSIFVYSAGD